ncbi:hypothetical protein TNCV_3210481 [Trichonephila clavipes]|nr:hypothetical protein TNCV_3210481 [Trichonephila clavipes]
MLLVFICNGIQKILELIFFATAVEKNVQQTVAAAMTIVTTCNFTFRSHSPLSLETTPIYLHRRRFSDVIHRNVTDVKERHRCSRKP